MDFLLSVQLHFTINQLKKERRIFLLDTQLSTYISIIIILVARHISQKGRWTLGGIQTRQIA